MILDTFTKEELISTLKNVVPIFRQRAENFMGNNVKKLSKQVKGVEYPKIFSGIIDGQRYYYEVVYRRDRDTIEMGDGPLTTVVTCGKRNLAVVFQAFQDPESLDGSYLKILTEHFLTRYCERTGMDVEKMSIIDKVKAWGHGGSGFYTSVGCGEFLKKYQKTHLKARFLDTEIFKTWYAASRKGDIAIVEQYGSIPVWRTFIAEEMLHDSQIEDPYYQAIKEMSAKQVEDPNDYIKNVMKL